MDVSFCQFAKFNIFIFILFYLIYFSKFNIFKPEVATLFFKLKTSIFCALNYSQSTVPNVVRNERKILISKSTRPNVKHRNVNDSVVQTRLK